MDTSQEPKLLDPRWWNCAGCEMYQPCSAQYTACAGQLTDKITLLSGYKWTMQTDMWAKEPCMVVHFGATWRIPWNTSCVAAMQPYVKRLSRCLSWHRFGTYINIIQRTEKLKGISSAVTILVCFTSISQTKYGTKLVIYNHKTVRDC